MKTHALSLLGTTRLLSRSDGGFGFDVALQVGALSDYQVMRLGSSAILTHNGTGDQDSFTDVEQIRFDRGPALTLAHSQPKR